VVTLFEMRFAGRSASAGRGSLSTTARARLAGMFSMIGTVAHLGRSSQRTKRDVFRMVVCGL
jgi:hypothetical protein